MRARLIEIFDELVQQKTKMLNRTLPNNNPQMVSENSVSFGSFGVYHDRSNKEIVHIRPPYLLPSDPIEILETSPSTDVINFVNKIIDKSPFALHLDQVDDSDRAISILAKLLKANLHFLKINLPHYYPSYHPSLKDEFATFFNNCRDTVSSLKILHLGFFGKLDNHIMNEICEFIASPNRPELLELDFTACKIEQPEVECLGKALASSQLKNIVLKFHYHSINIMDIGRHLDDTNLATLADALQKYRSVVNFDLLNLKDFSNCNDHPLNKKIQKCIERNRLLNTYPQYSAIIKQAFAEIGLGLPAECDSLKNITGKFALFNQCKGKLENLPLELKEHLDQIRNIYEIANKPRV